MPRRAGRGGRAPRLAAVKVGGVVAARACSFVPDPEGGGGALELTEVEVSQVFDVSPKRGVWDGALKTGAP